MKAGQVVRIRVNPKDCQSVLDLLEKIGLEHTNISFSQCVSITLGSLLETARASSLLPEPDPFQYLSRMGHYIGQGHLGHKAKVKTTQMIESLGERFVAPALAPLLVTPISSTLPAVANSNGTGGESADSLRERRRLGELYSKKDMWENGNREISWSEEEEEEFQTLFRKIYPAG